ncbi:MAG: MBL fold metallo-hydrolase [Micromonosporaceae bacterium]
MRIHRVGRDVSVLNDQTEVPGLGHLLINAFVLHAAEPVVVDTGLSVPGTGFMEALGSVIDPADVRWIWITHPDRDHTGGVFDLLDAAPRAKVITTFLGAGIMSTERPFPMDRVYFLNPGESMSLGDRTITAFRPPLFDSPATVGFYDDRSRAAFTSDCFGAPMPTSEIAGGDDVAALDATELRDRQLLWASVDSPWVHNVDPRKFLATAEPLRQADPEYLLSVHLPPARGKIGEFLDTLATAPDADRWIGPDQKALEELLASFEPEAAAVTT